MSFKTLSDFQSIFNREDFNYISDLDNISRVSDIIFLLSSPDGKEDDYKTLLQNFLKNFKSFNDFIIKNSIPDLEEAYALVYKELNSCINLFDYEPEKRKMISTRVIKRINKTFLRGLSLLRSGLDIVFDSDFISSTNILPNQIVRYIIDKKVGLGKNYLFNTVGTFAFMNRIYNLNLRELIVTLRLLDKPTENQIRSVKGWTDLGARGTVVRILKLHKRFGKDKIYFLYKVNEHEAGYKPQLNISPDKVSFEAA